MSCWPPTKANRVLAALVRIGWTLKQPSGDSHKVLERSGWADLAFSTQDDEEIGPRMMAHIAQRIGPRPDEL